MPLEDCSLLATSGEPDSQTLAVKSDTDATDDKKICQNNTKSVEIGCDFEILVMSQNGKCSKSTPTRGDEHVPIHFAKIVILGDVGVGKTSLVKVRVDSIRHAGKDHLKFNSYFYQ